MNQGHRTNASLTFLEVDEHLRVVDVARLQRKQADDDLEIVLHPVMNLLEQHLPFMQSVTKLRRSLHQFEGALFDAAFQFGIETAQPFLRPLALADVNDAGQHEGSLGHLHRAQADLDGHLAAVLAQSIQILSCRPHRRLLRRGEEPVLHSGLPGAEPFRHQHLHRLAQQLRPLVAEQLFRLQVDHRDAPVLAPDDHRVGRRVHHQAQPFLRPLALADVLNESAEIDLVPNDDGCDGQFHRKLAPVPVQRGHFHPSAQHGTESGFKVATHAALVRFPELGRDNRLRERFPNGLRFSPAEDFFRLRIPRQDAALPIDRDDGIERAVEDNAHLFFVLPQHFLRPRAFDEVNGLAREQIEELDFAYTRLVRFAKLRGDHAHRLARTVEQRCDYGAHSAIEHGLLRG